MEKVASQVRELESDNRILDAKNQSQANEIESLEKERENHVAVNISLMKDIDRLKQNLLSSKMR